MLTNLIENRGKDFSNLLKLGDFLGNSLRENVELFFVDDNVVTYITESGYVLSGKVQHKPHIKFYEIEVEDSSVLEDQEVFEQIAEKKVSGLLSNLIENDYSEAENSFDKILKLYETKVSYDRIKDRLREKSERFGESTNITNTPQFQRVLEIKDSIIKFLKENKDIVNYPEIKNGIKLANIISRSFNLPKITIQELKEAKKFDIPRSERSSLYEHLCQQELIAKEFLEAKSNLEAMWVNETEITELVSLMFKNDIQKIREQVAKIITQIPYFTLATKTQLTNIIKNSLDLNEIRITDREVNNFVKTIYEIKKPAKDYVVKLLNEKYGINVSNLTEVPTFGNLIKTESVILTALSRLAPKNSVIKKNLYEFVESIKLKNGVQSIDLAKFLEEMFRESGLDNVINETTLASYLDFNKVADDLGKIGQVLKMITPLVQGGAAQPGNTIPQAGGAMGDVDFDATPDLGGEEDLGTPDDMDSSEEAGLEDEDSPDPEAIAQEVAKEKEDEEMGGMPHEEPDGDEGISDEGNPLEGEEGLEDEEVDEEGQEEGEGGPVNHVDADELSDLVASVEDILADLKAELGTSDEVDTEDDEFSEFSPEEEGEEEVEGDPEVSEEETEEEPEEEIPQKPKFKK